MWLGSTRRVDDLEGEIDGVREMVRDLEASLQDLGEAAPPQAEQDPAVAAPTAAPVTPAAAPEAASFGDGSHEVGVDLPAGTYATDGDPEGAFGSGICSYSVHSLDRSDLLEFDTTEAGTPQVLLLAEGTIVESSGCGTWVLR